MNFTTQDPLSSLTIYWGSHSGNNSNFPPNPGAKLPTLTNWSNSHYPPVLQFSITPTSDLSTQPNPTQYLIDHTTNVYLYPASSGNNTCTTTGATPCAQGQILSGDCNPGAPRPTSEPPASTHPCSVTITGLGGKDYVVHYVDFYDTADIYVDGMVSTGGGAMFTGEPQIDVTGKARTALKRLQSRYFINGGTGGAPNDNDVYPNGAVEAQNLCKRIQAAPPIYEYSSIGSTFDPPPGAPSGACDLSN